MNSCALPSQLVSTAQVELRTGEKTGLHQQYQEVPTFESNEKVNLSFLSVSGMNERGRWLSEVCEK